LPCIESENADIVVFLPRKLEFSLFWSVASEEFGLFFKPPKLAIPSSVAAASCRRAAVRLTPPAGISFACATHTGVL
jgi:hypothetical protein